MLVCRKCLSRLVTLQQLTPQEARYIEVRLPTALDCCTFCHLLMLCFDDFDTGDIPMPKGGENT